ncbi:hypothetical protein ULMS_06620 [Patiriisocius marinistellae]|uniref:RagB/SusD domain-containing protein n=1 Tax=Patiriisocius marinistellae TaxID=2494560 RepID=A0A5J4FVK9_9FLAO|nr:RagB/SusD family nutrient uptake outer membrane protein [Patiriisocius marinistellae]GEQ85154.1 hypothetical protein ULMS_06620 [Patiriisocius marinistellae]
MKKHIYKIVLFAAVIGTFVSCEVEEFSDLNNPEVDAFENNLTRGDLQDLVGGLFYSSRVALGTYLDDCGVIGRDYYRFSGSDPRFTNDLLGGGTTMLDNNTFYITNPWAGRYRTVKNANLILGFLDGQDVSAQFSEAEVSATKGLLKTYIAHELLLNLNLTDENGIRTDVADEGNLGAFVSKTQALNDIQAILADAASDLAAGGSDFSFFFPSGFDGFDTPATFLQVTNAIAARVAIYRGDSASALSLLDNSFLELNGDLNTGLYYDFSEAGTDLINPIFISVAGSVPSNARVVHPSFLTDAEADDARVTNKTEPLPNGEITLDNLAGDTVLNLYQSNNDAIPLIRNEELILIYAEASITSNPANAVNALSIVRMAAGLPAYTGPTDAASLTTEMLKQRRYSLYGEGHRWIDVRRYGLLDTLPIDRVDTEGNPDDVWSSFPIPLTENQ